MSNPYQLKIYRYLAILQLSLAAAILIVLVVNGTEYKQTQIVGTGIVAFLLITPSGIFGFIEEYLTSSSSSSNPISHALKLWHLFLTILSATLCGLFFVLLVSSFIENSILPLPTFVIQLILFFVEFVFGLASATLSCFRSKSISNRVVIYRTVENF